MTRTTSAKDTESKINEFLKSDKISAEFRFGRGYFIKLKKCITNAKQFLEIHTSGYDDTLPVAEAIDWLRWELLDREANGLFEI